jgi:hypothetical protein
MSRVKNTQLIIEEIGLMSDAAVTGIYNKMWTFCEEEGDKKNSRAQKIKFIISNLNLVSDNDLPKIKGMLDDAKKYENMYKILLEALNKLLEHNDLELIEDITDFKDIQRELLANEECNQIILNMIDDFIEVGFKKNTNGFHSYKKLKFANLNIIKGLCTQLGYVFVSVKKSKMVKLNRTFITYYSIEKAT